ncbi:uncharacterized protein LOC113922723 isoform X2 [Zalophus californianus]|uniref:Uncharacterized protein LOC113922723 isoform X2 n=1 Tax=Zalophus californianus TaxID=9704 RepID=A0A6J2D3V9_ZALCA|nr:uncharacterized protein LOC113922723 isoform X2 [Zalophus californianus]
MAALRQTMLNDIVERKDQMYGIDNGFKSLEDIVNLLVVNSCHEVMAGESYFVCVRDRKALEVTGRNIMCPGHIIETDEQGGNISFTPAKPLCKQLPCSSKINLPPNKECFPLNSCCSWSGQEDELRDIKMYLVRSGQSEWRRCVSLSTLDTRAWGWNTPDPPLT